jgi:hypothetical protein
VSKTRRSPAPPPEPTTGPLVPIEAASEWTGLTCRQLRLAVRKGRLAAFRPSGFARGRLAFAERDLVAFLRCEPHRVRRCSMSDRVSFQISEEEQAIRLGVQALSATLGVAERLGEPSGWVSRAVG